MDPASLRAITAWTRLNAAIDAFNASLRREFGLSGLQLALLRILAEESPQPLGALRDRLVLHPATVGQAVDALAARGLCTVTPAPDDRRAKVVSVAASGRELLTAAPVAGPVRLRGITDPARAQRLADAFDDAVELFGLQPWAADTQGRSR